MKTLALQRRIAASVLNAGQNKVWLDPERISEIKEAITKVDIAELIKEGAIKKKPVVGVKRKAGKKQKKKRKIGGGKRKKIVKKDTYTKKIRKLRAFIKALKKADKINIVQYHKIRKLAKAGMLKTKQDIEKWIKS